MKRDMEFVRGILLAIEECDENGYSCLDTKISEHLIKEGYNHDRNLLFGHCRIMEEAGLIRFNDRGRHLFALKLTWEGHEFLSDVKDKNVWDQVKEVVSKRDGISFAVLKTIVTEISKQLI